MQITKIIVSGITLILLHVSVYCLAQEADQPPAAAPPVYHWDRALTVEAGGLGGIYAIGYESEVLHTHTLSWITTLGGTLYGQNNKTGFGITLETSLLSFSGNRKQAFEWGIGAVLGWHAGIGYVLDNNNTLRKAFTPAYSMRLGSRYYFMHGRMFLKLAFMPFVSQYYNPDATSASDTYKWKLYPGGGLAIGYCF